ncbi:MAG: serine/threonine protein kinase, partial [Deltaproteobacteria bacterium]
MDVAGRRRAAAGRGADAGGALGGRARGGAAREVAMTPQALVEPARFGDRYTLIERVAVGGMAEIYRARQDAIAGFEKDVVIKRLKPELAGDDRVVDMFLDEARISAVLNHPNVVHVYDVGEAGGTPYIAMEYIAGEELTDLCRRGLQLGRFLPLPHAVELMRQAARGLGYIHAKRGKDGEPLDIVHCDISPTNLLVTEDGELKIIDFGIARSRHQRARDAAILPGKLSYMSPEQASRGPVDHRSDIFSLGVVLYEITLGRRLFKGKASDVVQRLREGDIPPPTFVRRDYPGPLEAVVMRALERHPEDRYETAYDMADELSEFLREADLRTGPLRIARYLDQLAAAAGGARRAELVAEAERRAAEAEDELDFDRGLFDGFRGAEGGSAEAAAEWDEVDEDTREIAAALGVAPDQLDRGGARVEALSAGRSGRIDGAAADAGGAAADAGGEGGAGAGGAS